MLSDVKKPKSIKQELREAKNAPLDAKSTGEICAYLVHRHRVFFLAAGYPVITTLVLVLHYGK